MTQFDFQTWVETYKPILNPFMQTSYFDGYFIATLKEVENYLESQVVLGVDNVWSIAKSSEKTGQILSGLYEEAEGEIFGYFVCQVPEANDKITSFPTDHRLWNQTVIFQLDDASGKWRFGNYGKRKLVLPSELGDFSPYAEDGGPLEYPHGQNELKEIFDDWRERYDVVCHIEPSQESEFGKESVRFLIEEVDPHFVWSEDLVHSDQALTYVTRGNAGDIGNLDDGIYPIDNPDRTFYLARNPWQKNLIEQVYTLIPYGCSECNRDGKFENEDIDECESCYGSGVMLFDCKTGEIC